MRKRYRSATLGIRNHQSPGFVDAVTPLGDIVSIQSATGLIGSVFLHQLTLAAHGFLSILPGVIKVRQVERDTDEGTHHAHCRSLSEAGKFSLPDGIHQVGNHHEEDDEEIVVSHLHVVGIHLESREDGGEEQALQILTPVSQHHARNHWRQIGKCPHLPDMTGGDDDKEVG